ncbi:maleylpyruvate isomerase family mycothiol-dependent enzyme [Streptomyces sp. NPDC092952]|uniref:maleylpyruvate isomerase family mycothiol-dependent enzyme n=1 Tax=Streptomyces sp. NPDC092952 TaxID=3366018 RepID=UPI00380B7E27
MSSLTHDRYCTEIASRAEAFRAAIRGADLSTTVPTCPEWDLRALAHHIGQVHHWVAEIVRTRSAEVIPPDRVPNATPADEDAETLDAWLAEGAAAAVEALRDAGPEVKVWSWAWEGSTGFWARRMAHETIVHHADAALTTGTGFEVDPELAADTIEEWLQIVDFVQSSGSERAAGLTAPGAGTGHSLHLHATDAPGAEWLVGFGEDGYSWRRAHGKADVTLRAPLTELLLVFNRRLPVDHDGVEVIGDREVLDLWLKNTEF